MPIRVSFRAIPARNGQLVIFSLGVVTSPVVIRILLSIADEQGRKKPLRT